MSPCKYLKLIGSATVLVAALSGCTAPEAYEQRFAGVAIGATRAELLERMKTPPDDRSRLDLPLVSVEQLTWKSRLDGRRYVAQLALDHVVGKSVD